MLKKILFVATFLMLSCAFSAKAANVGDIVSFNVDPNYDATGRSQVAAMLVRVTPQLYFYVEKTWWDVQDSAKQNEIFNRFDELSNEFVNKIYPVLTSVYGSEDKPGIDKDTRISVFFETINNNLGGYYRSTDEYSKLQAPSSNEREMVYLPITQITSPSLKVFLAHEFTHLIVFNQKERLQDVTEEIWLSEARSDYASSILGYDDVFEGSNLQRRVQDFLSQPGDSLTEWRGSKYDYSAENLFMHYLVDHYGLSILTDSLKSKLVGIPSINEALAKKGFTDDFSKIFTNWTIAVMINNCSIDTKYCYFDKNLTNLKISPNLIFLPLIGSSSLSISNTAKDWSGSWQKIIGGNGDLKLEFIGQAGLIFKVPYIIYDKKNNFTVNFLTIDKNGRGAIDLKNFGTQYDSLVIIPSLQSKILGFNGSEFGYPYGLTISIVGATPQQNSLQGSENQQGCGPIINNLTVGMRGALVVCLQQFLKAQGSDIYPEGLVTGTFGNLTKMAVIRFQEKYKGEILAPVGLLKGTGFVGNLTRAKINQLLQK